MHQPRLSSLEIFHFVSDLFHIASDLFHIASHIVPKLFDLILEFFTPGGDSTTQDVVVSKNSQACQNGWVYNVRKNLQLISAVCVVAVVRTYSWEVVGLPLW